jgi:hypothetical protein
MLQGVCQHVSHFDTDAVAPFTARMTQFCAVNLKFPFDFSKLSPNEGGRSLFRSAERTKLIGKFLTELMDSNYKLRQAHAHAFQARALHNPA